MKCPYCNKEMEKGSIQSPCEIAWVKSERPQIFLMKDTDTESVVLAKQSFLTGSVALACICRDCKIVLIDYSDDKCDIRE